MLCGNGPFVCTNEQRLTNIQSLQPNGVFELHIRFGHKEEKQRSNQQSDPNKSTNMCFDKYKNETTIIIIRDLLIMISFIAIFFLSVYQNLLSYHLLSVYNLHFPFLISNQLCRINSTFREQQNFQILMILYSLLINLFKLFEIYTFHST